MTLVERRTTTDVAEGDPEYTGAAEPGTSRPELRLVLLFLAIGAATTILHLGAFAALRSTSQSVRLAPTHIAASVIQAVTANTAAPDTPAPTAQPPASMPPKPINTAPTM